MATTRLIATATFHALSSMPIALAGERDSWQRFESHDFAVEIHAIKEIREGRHAFRYATFGDEAFWVGDPLSGALYVLKGDVFLRVSVGGPTDEAQKIKRARALASHALKRLVSR